MNGGASQLQFFGYNNIVDEGLHYSSNSYWTKLNENGFGTRHNVASRTMETFNDSLIIGTTNYNNIDNFTSIPINLLGSFFDLSNFGNVWVDLDTDGCEIWACNESGSKVIVGNGEQAVSPPGFGNKNNKDCSLLIEFNGSLYAGVWNDKEGCQIWRTRDINEEWELILDEGFGNKNNIAVWTSQTFNGCLYVGTVNFIDGCTIFKTEDGENWVSVVGGDSPIPNGFGTDNNYYIWSMEIYDADLYIGTLNPEGCELWKTTDGVNYDPVVAYPTFLRAKLQGADFPQGFGKKREHIVGIREMVVYNNELYLGLVGGDIYVDLTLPYIGTIPLLVQKRFFDFRRVIPSLAQVWKYNSTTDKWTRVVGGIGNKNTSAGFGDPLNCRVWSMKVYNNSLYVGTAHPGPIAAELKRNSFLNWTVVVGELNGNGEIWEYNGDYWSQVDLPKDLDDGYNIGIREMSVFNNSLIIGTFNLEKGCELWKYNT